MNDDILINIVANVTGAVNNINKVSSSLKGLNDSTKKQTSSFTKTADVTENLSRKLKPLSLLAGGLFTKAFKDTVDYEQQMARVGVISGANKKQMEQLKDSAIKFGQTSVFSVGEVGDAMDEMAQQGFNAKSIINDMPSALHLAQASATDLTEATSLLGTTMKTYGDGVYKSSHLSDVFAKASNTSRASVDYLNDSLSYSLQPASQLNVGIEDLTAATSILADRGFKASTSGRGLRTMFTNLAKPTAQASDLMNQLGFSAFDNNGKFKGLSKVIKEYNEKTAGMTPKQKEANAAILFGKEGMNQWLALVKAGPKKIDKYSESLKNSKGYSEKLADTLQNNLGAKFKNMIDTWQGAGIKMIESISGSLKNIISWLTGLADKIQKMDPKKLQVLATALAAIAALAPGLLIFSGVVRVIGGVVRAFNVLKNAITVVKGVLVALGLTPMGALITAIAALVAGAIYFFTQTKTGKKLWGEFMDYLNQVWQSILATFWETIDYITTGWDETVQAVKDVWSGITDFFSNLWQSIVDTVTSVGQAISDAWSAVVQFFKDLWNGVVEFFVGIWNGIVDTVATVIQTIQGMWQAFVDFFTGIFQTISDTSSTVWNAIVTFLQPIIDTMTDLWNNFVTTITGIWNGIKETAASVWDLIKTVILGPILLLVDLLTGNWTQMWDDAKMLWGHLKDDVVGIAKGLWDIVKAYVTGLMNDVKIIWDNIVKYAGTAWNNLWKTVTNFAKDVWNDIVNIWKSIPGWVSNLWNNVKSTVSNLWNSIVSGVQNGAKNAWNGLVNIWNSIPGWVSSLWSNVVSTVSGWWSNIVGTVSSYANSAWSSLVNIWNGIPGWVASLWSNVVSTVSSWWNSIVSWVSSGANNAFNSLISVWNGIPGWVSGVWSDVVNTVYDWLGSIDIWNLGWNIITGFVNGLKSAWNAGKDFVSGIGKWIRDHKGPISYDRRLLIPAGNAIMNGLHKGLKSSFQPVMNTVGAMAGQIENAMSVSPTVNTSAIQRSINGQIAVAVSGERVQPATFNLQLGGTSFTAFVDDISKQQGRSARLSRTTRLS